MERFNYGTFIHNRSHSTIFQTYQARIGDTAMTETARLGKYVEVHCIFDPQMT
jgi:hypothetical protein